MDVIAASGTISSDFDSSPVAGSPATSLMSETSSLNVSPHYIHVPDMFSSIMAVKPVVNPHYHEVKFKADAWIARTISASQQWAARNSKVDLAYLASIWAPYCDEEALRMMVDWNHWVFLFDDQFDEGHLSTNLAAADEEIKQTLALMEDDAPVVRSEENPIRHVFQTCWYRLKKVREINPSLSPARSTSTNISPAWGILEIITCLDLRDRWKERHQHFFDGLLAQVRVQQESRMFSREVQEYMSMRRRTIGAFPAIALTEFALGIDLSRSIIDHPCLQECMTVSADLVLLVNDILSYKKDLKLGVDHNLITLLQKKDLSMQEAVDKISEMLNNCYRRWYSALANMPIWGEDVDRQVLKFVDACRNVALGNLYWSFKTGRYLGPEGESVRETRMINMSF
ncbi:terpene synthase family protein [Aspergillus affinis]|uniref:terpene synthase family protein n=1 Tax=Aspergillus affinis TaxID=1070780 RepID=UPI0022FEAF12|nr:uncharacterized protein KD926_003261 [Aspergillus affinis]KAI9035559.1 hypothetical protein KD926_003261 [Aspergillus affinis]